MSIVIQTDSEFLISILAKKSPRWKKEIHKRHRETDCLNKISTVRLPNFSNSKHKIGTFLRITRSSILKKNVLDLNSLRTF